MEEYTELWRLIDDSKRGNIKATEKLYLNFKPLLKKYSNVINTEDAFSELSVKFLEVLKSIPIYDKKFIGDDKYILSYIKTSIKNAYIQINSQNKKYDIKNELTSDIEKYTYVHSKGQPYINQEKYCEYLVLLDEMKKFLTKKDYCIIIMKYFGISKQAINQKLKILLKKLNKIFK